MSDNQSPLTDPQTGEALPEKVQPGYYPRWRVMREYRYWDAATREVVTKRLEPPKPLRFFTPDEAAVMEAVLDRILPQDDRLEAQRIPLLPVLDTRLADNKLEGYRYEDMPPDQEAYRQAVRALDAMAHEVYGSAFASLNVTSQELLLKSLHDGEPAAAKQQWAGMNVSRFWTLLVSDACSAYYSHPWAWDEVGFGGPAYPRGYMRLEHGDVEPWEFPEERYEWAAPSDSVSDYAEPEGEHTGSAHGQAGTH